MKQSRIVYIYFLITLFAFSSVHATVIPDPIFRNNMVLQRNQPIVVFGKASNETSITVKFKGKEYETDVQNGLWRVEMDSTQAGGPYSLEVKGSNTQLFSNILVGDVWVCSGQSNMVYAVSALSKKYPEIFTSEDLNYTNNNIRYMWTKRIAADQPSTATVMQTEWQSITPDNLLKCSAAAYFFAKKIQESTNVPIGLVLANHGGTSINSWVSNDVLASREAYKPILDEFQTLVDNYDANYAQFEIDLAKWIAENVGPDEKFSDLPWDRKKHAPRAPLGANHIKRPSGLYNGMIAPLTQLSVCGVIWYQGENDASDFTEPLWYKPMFKDLINSWRSAWNREVPFYFCQLAAFKNPVSTPVETEWVRLREAQTAALDLPLTGMATLTDAGKKSDIHPPYKKQAGERLALHALKQVYHQDLICTGPTYKRHSLNGDKYTVVFDNIGKGLQSKTYTLDGETVDASTLKGFSICNADLNWKWADAKIVNDSTVEVWHSDIIDPIALRYAWANFPMCNLYNSADLPAVPFRTDSLPPDAIPSGVDNIFDLEIPDNAYVGEQAELKVAYSASVPSELHLTLFQKTPWKSIITAASKVDVGSGRKIMLVDIPKNAIAGPHVWSVSIGAEGSSWREWLGKTIRSFDLKEARATAITYIKLNK